MAYSDCPLVRGHLIAAIQDSVSAYVEILRQYDSYTVHLREDVVTTYETWNAIIAASELLKFVMGGG